MLAPAGDVGQSRARVREGDRGSGRREETRAAAGVRLRADPEVSSPGHPAAARDRGTDRAERPRDRGLERLLEGVDEQGEPHTVDDVRARRLQEAARTEKSSPGVLLDLGEVFGDLGSNERLRSAYADARARLKSNGSMAVLERVAGQQSDTPEATGAESHLCAVPGHGLG